MYSLIVWHGLDEIAGRIFSVPIERFLEYTSEPLVERLGTLSDDALEAIRGWPMLIMSEGQTSEQAFVLFSDSVRKSGVNIVVQVQEERLGPILNEQIWKLRRALDIADWEFGRSHWAIKEIDLFQTLADAGIPVSSSLRKQVGQSQLGPTRLELVAIRNQIGELGHKEIDDILMLAGIKGLDAGRNVGSRADRANAILEFVLEHPGAITAERKLFSSFLASFVEVEVEVVEESNINVVSHVSRDPKRVFVVHGRNHEVKDTVVAFLRRVGLDPVVLHDRPSMGRHLLTKFMEEAELTTFAVILMTDDDWGGEKSDSLHPRARQNVIFELGYFMSRLGQERVCALVTPGLQTPSDFDGIVYVPLDEASDWETVLLRELKAAKMPANQQTSK